MATEVSTIVRYCSRNQIDYVECGKQQWKRPAWRPWVDLMTWLENKPGRTIRIFRDQKLLRSAKLAPSRQTNNETLEAVNSADEEQEENEMTSERMQIELMRMTNELKRDMADTLRDALGAMKEELRPLQEVARGLEQIKGELGQLKALLDDGQQGGYELLTGLMSMSEEDAKNPAKLAEIMGRAK